MENASLKKKKLKKEFTEVKEKLNYVICQMQNMQCRIDIESPRGPKLRVPQYDDLTGDKVTANDLSQVVLLNSNTNLKKGGVLNKEDLEYQENRRKRKVRKLNFEIR